MRPFLRTWTLRLGAGLFAVLLALAGGSDASAPDAAASGPGAAAASVSCTQEGWGDALLSVKTLAPDPGLPAPTLSAWTLVPGLAAGEWQHRGPLIGRLPRSAGSGPADPPGGDAVESRIRMVRLAHLSFAADHAAARAGLFSSRGIAPPPPLG